MGDFKIERVTDDIIVVRSPTKKQLSELFVRFAEHYESPIPEIRGKVFTLGQYKQLYAMRNGAFTYHRNSIVDGDWSGYNIPSYVLDPFIKGLFDPLTQQEADFVEMFRWRTGNYYIIGVNDEGRSCVDHEVDHALYYLNPDFKRRVDEVILSWDQVPAMGAMLKEWGYCDEVIIDEIQAYIGADFEWLKEKHSEDLTKHGIRLDATIRDRLVQIKDELFKPVDPKFKQGVMQNA